MEDLTKLQNILMENFATFQNGVEAFMVNNNKMLNFYLDSVDSTEQRLVLRNYKDYIAGLFGMLIKTTDFIKDMMIRAQTLGKTHDANIENIVPKINECKTGESNSSESTVTGYKAGFTFMSDSPLAEPKTPNDFNGSSFFNGMCSKPNLFYKMVDTSNLKSGSIISKACVTSVQLEELCFYICPPNPTDIDILSKLFAAQDRETYECPPVSGVIFGMKIEGGIIRVIRCLPVTSGKVFMMDFGDIVDVETNLNSIFHLSKEEQNVPAQAISCKLHIPKDATNSEISYERVRLSKLLYNQASFRVIENNDGTLYLEILNSKEEISILNEISTPLKTNSVKEISKEDLSMLNEISTPSKTNSIQEISSTTNQNHLSLEELEMLYEEPSCTSNALMAVTGYVPKDDQRICRFYDPKIEGCFKGNNCRQIHIPLRKDHITKDLVPANAFSEPRVSTGVTVQYQTNEILKVKVTHLTDLQYFYGIIINDSRPVEQVTFTDRDIRPSDYLKRPPLAYDIVLAKYVDGLWYRAEVTDVDEFEKTIKVFYMDYGNRQTVTLKNLARCTEIVAKIPPQVQQFRINDISINSDSDEETLLRGMGMLCDMILDHETEVKVVSHYEDLVVQFLNEPYSDIPHILADMHCVKLIKMLPV